MPILSIQSHVSYGRVGNRAAVFAARAAELGCPLRRHGHEWMVARDRDQMLFRDAGGERHLPLPSLLGEHQIDNAGVALACLPYLDRLAVGDDAIRHGLTHVEWPARMQRLTRGPLARSLPAGWELWLDGCHNADGGRAAAAVAAEWARQTSALPLHLIFGSLSTHDPQDILAPFRDLARDVRTVAIPGDHKTRSAEDSAASATRAGLRAQSAPGVADALHDIVATADGPARVLICGSLYLAGTILAENG